MYSGDELNPVSTSFPQETGTDDAAGSSGSPDKNSDKGRTISDDQPESEDTK